MNLTLENKVHETKISLKLREDIIQPGVFKDVKKHLCKCGGSCGCSKLGHTHSEHHVCTCRDSQGEEYALVQEVKKIVEEFGGILLSATPIVYENKDTNTEG